MAFQLYLTPASISYLTEFILGLAITLFLLNRVRSQRSRSLLLLTAFFAPMTVFTGLLVFNASLLPFPRLLTVYAENATLGLALTALNAFAYHFPERYPQHKWEMRVTLACSLAYFFWEVGFMIFRYIALCTQGNVFIRPPLVAYCIPIVILFAPFGFLRQTLAADPRPLPFWRRLWKPEGKGARGARNFALALGVPVALGIVNALVFFGVSLMVIHAIVSVGILIMLWLLATNYVNFIPGSVDVASRLSILTLTLFLALLGTVGWLIAPPYIATFKPNLRDHQTLRFTPNAAGGYDVSAADFHFETALGEKVRAQDVDKNGNHRIEFTFPFYRKTYAEAYVNNSGIISFGQPFHGLNLQADAVRVPTLFPLVISLNPSPAEEDSGLYVRLEPERLIVTWNRMPATSQPETRYTFQTILYADGTFEFTYNGLPQSILFTPNSAPADNPLLRGVAAGRVEPLYQLPAGMEEPADLVSISHAGASPLLENHLLEFRRYLHVFMVPIAWVVVGGSLLILLLIPLLLRASVTRPLKALTAGVRRMGAGETDITIAVQTEDEIGFLTGAFNSMSAALDGYMRNLETRVAKRTRELDDANTKLRASETSMRSLIENVRDVFIRYDLNLRYQYVSPVIQNFMDATPESFIGKTHREAGFPEDKAEFFDASLREAIQSQKPVDVEFTLPGRDGEYMLQTRVYPEFNERGEVVSVVTVTSDITEQKQAEAQREATLEKLRQAQAQIVEQQRAVAALEERERLARELHDGIGQTLGYINMQAEAARELSNKADKQETQLLARLAEVAREAYGDLRGYIQNLTSATPAPREDFFYALERYCEHLRQAYLFDVTLRFPPSLPDPLASAKTETHLTYIIREALSNARRYSGQSRAQVCIDFDEESVETVIEDRGGGIRDQHAENADNARERFGLRIMRERASEAGGTLVIESEIGKGTRVSARLPRNLSENLLTQLRILIADDHPVFAEGLRNMLTARGAQVIGIAQDGIEARAAAQNLKPDVILMDIRMPRMNGLAAARQIKAKMPETKIVMLTTAADEANIFEALRAGASGFLLKGMHPEVLVATLGNLARDEAEFSMEMAQKILAEFPPMNETNKKQASSEVFDKLGLLTVRQREILRLVANGLTYKETGTRLFLTERTVKYHMGEILARLQLKGRHQAEIYARHKGIK